MSDTKSPKATKQIAVTLEAWEKARKMAGLQEAKGNDADIGSITTEAIMNEWSKVPAEVREFLEQAEPQAAA